VITYTWLKIYCVATNLPHTEQNMKKLALTINNLN
jgi:hypothetical protein